MSEMGAMAKENEILHAFSNPGTADHVVKEIDSALQSLEARRAALEGEYAQAEEAYRVQHTDLSRRIQMLEAATYSQQPPEKAMTVPTKAPGEFRHG